MNKNASTPWYLTWLMIFFGLLAVVLGVANVYLATHPTPPSGEVFIQEPYRQARIVIDAASPSATIQPFWQAFSQGGEESGINMLEGTEKVLLTSKPGYIRLDHIFDDDFYGVTSSMVNGEWSMANGGKLNWEKLDKVVDSILVMRAKPYFSLSYMPKALADTKISQPHDWKQWQELVGETIRHYSGRSGKNITGVYYEVWNEPDLESFGYWKMYGPKNYLDLYKYAALAAKEIRESQENIKYQISKIKNGEKDDKIASNSGVISNKTIKQYSSPSLLATARASEEQVNSATDSGKLVNDFKIGGPATTALYENWVKGLINFTVKEQLPLDFISWHRYSINPGQYRQDILNIKNQILKIKANLEEKGSNSPGTVGPIAIGPRPALPLEDGNSPDRRLLSPSALPLEKGGVGKDYELIISEWGPDSEKNTIYSNQISASHAVATTRAMMGESDNSIIKLFNSPSLLTSAGASEEQVNSTMATGSGMNKQLNNLSSNSPFTIDHSPLSMAFAFEVKDGPGQNGQGWGLISNQDNKYLPKPRLQAFNWLSQMNGQRLNLTGEGSSVTGWATVIGNQIKLILTNFNPVGGKLEEFPLEINNLIPGQYKLIRQTFNGNPTQESFKIATTSGSYKRRESLSPNDILMLTLTHQTASISSTLVKPITTPEATPSGFGRLIKIK